MDMFGEEMEIGNAKIYIYEADEDEEREFYDEHGGRQDWFAPHADKEFSWYDGWQYFESVQLAQVKKGDIIITIREEKYSENRGDGTWTPTENSVAIYIGRTREAVEKERQVNIERVIKAVQAAIESL